VVGDGSRQRLDADLLAVAELFALCAATGEIDELARVGDVAGARDADVIVGFVDLFDALALHERRADLSIRGEDHAVGRAETDARGSAFDGLAGVLDLVETSIRGEDGDPRSYAC